MYACIRQKIRRFLRRAVRWCLYDQSYPTCQMKEHISIARNCSLKNSEFGRYVNIAHHASVMDCVVDDRTSIERYSKLRGSDIGKYCSISWDVTIGAVSHPQTTLSSHAFTYRKQFGLVDDDTFLNHPRTRIGNDVWIGCNSVIISGVSVGDGAIIGAGAVVTRDVPPYHIVAGVPARVIRPRFPDERITAISQLKWWDWPDEMIRKNISLFQKDLDDEVIGQLSKLAVWKQGNSAQSEG